MSALLCRDVYTSAKAMLAEPLDNNDMSRHDDYDERAPYLIAAMCDEARAMDAVFRQATGQLPQPDFSPVCIELTAPFLLTERFAAPAAAYLAAMLIIDENEALSDTLYSRYCDLMSDICAACPASSKAIIDVYGFN